ncbi:conjugal transfer protein TraB [Streptomyces angustmyceticus]|uniref:conjugal transfer protein TraB n=1 Tax=Streptomyces angustmyceticus TaxID=285578 RepID=UPI00344DFF2C
MSDTTKSTAAKGGLAKIAKHHHARPYMALLAEVPATFLANQAWGGSTVAAIGMTVAGGILTAGTWWAAQGTTAPRRIQSTVTMGAAMGYTTIATFTDPLGASQLSCLAMGGGVAAGLWTVRKMMRVNPEAKTDAATAGETGLLVKSIGKAKMAMRREPKVEPNKVTVPYQITAPGELTNAEIGKRIDNIATELGVSPNSVRVRPDTNDASLGELVVIPKDMLVEKLAWPGPSRFGGSIVDAVSNGRYEDGTPVEFWFPCDEKKGRNATHFGAVGMNGSGKSAGIGMGLVDAMTRRDVIVWACDPAKGRQTFAPFMPFLDWVELSVAGGEAMIDALSMVITARADALGMAGFKNWTPEAFEKLGMPYMIVWLEEAGKLFREGAQAEGLVQEARSAGISVIISIQRPSSTAMNTDVREQLGGMFCFGVNNETTTVMALDDDVIDQGARPEVWKNQRPGYFYLVAPGVDEERFAMPCRTWTPPSDEEIVAILSQAPRAQADPVTANAAGEAYANRARYAEDELLNSDDTDQGQESIVMTKEDSAAAERQLLERQADREVEALVGSDPDDDGFVPDVDPEQEIKPAAVTWTFGQAAPVAEDRAPEVAFAELLAMLAEYRGQEREEVGPKDFQPYGKGGRIGRSRAWISEKLGDLADEGIHLEETPQPGVYKLLYPEMATA